MTLEQLRIFVEVAARQHVTEAARALNLTQSATSNAIAALEQRHGIQLFDRVGRGIVLNQTGRVFLPEARAVLARAEAACGVLADLSALRRGRLAIFASQTIAGYWLPRHLAAFNARHPGVSLDVMVGNTREAADAVLGGMAELGFVEGELEEKLLEQTEVGVDRLVIAIHPAHPWLGKPFLSAADFLAHPWVLREPGSGTRSSLEQLFATRGVDIAALKVAMTLPSNEALLGAAEAGAGATALSEQVAAASLAAGRLARAAVDFPARRYWMLRHRERYRSRAADSFVAGLAGAPASPPFKT